MVVDKNKIDIAIIGGGIQGVLLAYYAKIKFPTKKISLFESQVIGGGITAHSGHLHTHYGNGEKFELAEQSIKLYKELILEYGNFPMEERNFIGICKKDNLNNVLSDLTQKEIFINKEIYPFSSLSDEFVTISGLKAYVTKRDLLTYLMEIIIAKGVRVHEGNKIDHIEKKDDAYWLTTQVTGKIEVEVLLNATGKDLLNTLNEKNIKVRSKKVVAFHIDKLDIKYDSVYYFFDDDAFLLPQSYFKRYLFSYKCEEWDIDIDSKLLKINSNDIKNAKGILNKYTNDFSQRILGGQVSLDLYNTPSSSPLTIKLDKNYYAVGVTGGSGIRLAPALAIKTLNKITL